MKFEYKIAIAYILLGCLWILFSDKLVMTMFSDPDTITRVQTFKGWLYVIVTGLLFFFLLRHHLEKLRRAEQRAKESDRLKTTFIQNISHEIRTPMNGIIGFTELLKDKSLTDQEKTEYLRIISESSALLFNIVNEVLDISLIESGTQKVNISLVSLNEICNEIFHSYTHEIRKGISFTIDPGASNGNDLVLTDGTKVKQILRNLVSNSMKFVEKGFIKFGYVMKDMEVEFFVEDSGIGISKEKQDHIFDRFFKDDTEKTKLYDGVGLGLAISKGLTLLLGGRIWLESEPGQGARFSFTIPIKKTDFAYVNTEKRKEIETLEGFRPSQLSVLIAEDDPQNQMYISEALRRMGFNTILASDGGKTLELCRKHMEINLVFMDIKMPVMDGYEVSREIRKFRPDLYIIAQTAFALNEKEKALSAGFDDYIAKPFKMEQLREVINAFKARDKS